MSALRTFRAVSMAEGVSFLALLLVAMPLKYFFAMPLAVRIAGSVHGLLFLAFILALVRVVLERGWPLGRAAIAFVASVVPGGVFFLDGLLRRELEGASRDA